MALGQSDEPTHVIAHISDTHFLGGKRPLYGAVDTDSRLEEAMDLLIRSDIPLDAIVFTGDIADLAEEDAYRRIRSIVEPAAHTIGAELIWVMGNHDQREPFRQLLLDEAPSMVPVDRVHEVAGLRIISLDTSVPGYHHGDLSQDQLAWLAEQLKTPAEHGTILALHHPPLPAPIKYMQVLELQNRPALAEIVAGSDVRSILGGHLHYSTHSQLGVIPVSVAAATCYTIDPAERHGALTGRDGGQSINLVHVYADQVVHSTLPLGDFARVSHFGDDFTARLESVGPDERRERYSRQPE